MGIEGPGNNTKWKEEEDGYDDRSSSFWEADEPITGPSIMYTGR